MVLKSGFLSLVTLLSVLGQLPDCQAQPPPGYDRGVPELAVIDRFSGTWEAQVVNSDETIRATRKWILNGRFQQHEFELASGNLRGLIYRGYDQERKRYTMTLMESQGSVSMLVGDWNAELRTLSFRAIDSSCFIQTYESHFPDDNTEQWTLTTGGENPVEVSGIVKRISNP